MGREVSKGKSPMGYLIFDRDTKLAKGSVKALGEEKGIVAETIAAVVFIGDLTLTDPGKKSDASLCGWAVGQESENTAEPSAALLLGNGFEKVEQFRVVGGVAGIS